jgi:hypothetical protein
MIFLSGLAADCDLEGAEGGWLNQPKISSLLFSPSVTVFGGTTMLSVTSLVRALFGSPTLRKRPTWVRSSLTVESLEGRALLSSTPLLPDLHHAGEAQHQQVEHGPEIQIEDRTALKAQADDHGANRGQDGVNDQNDDRLAKAQVARKDDHGAHRGHDGANHKNRRHRARGRAVGKDDRGANRRQDGANDKNDDRGVKVQVAMKDDHGANRGQDGINDKIDDRGGNR